MSGPAVGFIGLGEMGLPMAGNLGAAGWTVIGYDVSPGPREAARSRGIELADSCAQVAAAVDRTVVTMVRTLPRVDEVLFGEHGCASATARTSRRRDPQWHHLRRERAA